MPKITALSQLDLEKSYSYADYLTWQFGEIVELVKGKISAMAPAPNVGGVSTLWMAPKVSVKYLPFERRISKWL